MEKIGLGGGCHWCTEAVFVSLKGVICVEQGWIAAVENKSFSEAVIVHYDPAKIGLRVLIAVHLYTHSSTANHSMRNKYRSAVYTFTNAQQLLCSTILADLQVEFNKPLVTQSIHFYDFRPSMADEQDYYYRNPAKPFCETHIHPKMKILLEQFSGNADTAKIKSSY